MSDGDKNKDISKIYKVTCCVTFRQGNKLSLNKSIF